MTGGRRWTVRDRYGNDIYLTEERWAHIIEPMNHPEMADYEEELKETIRLGRHTQAFDNLPAYNTHIVAIVLFRFSEVDGNIIPNNYIVTAYQKEIR
jgi:hypothetical protein